MCLAALYLCLRTHHYPAATRLVCILHALQTIDICSCREVWCRNVFHQSLGIHLRIVYERTASVDDLAQVVSRHIGSHTHGYTIATIHQQVRHLRRHHAGLLQGVVEVVHHRHGVLLQVVHDVLTHLRQSTLGITHRSR